MAKTDFKSKIKINTYDDLFGGPVSLNEVKYLSLNDLHDFKDHPFQVKDDEDIRAMSVVLKDCSEYERKILCDNMKSLKLILRDNSR